MEGVLEEIRRRDKRTEREKKGMERDTVKRKAEMLNDRA